MKELALMGDIDLLYNSNTLREIYLKYLYVFDQAKGIEKRKKNELSKIYLVELMTEILLSEKNFNKFIKMLPEEVEKIIQLIIWEGDEIDVIDIEEKFKVNIIKSRTSYEANGHKNMETPYCFLGVRSFYKNYNFYSSNDKYRDYNYIYKFYFPSEIRKVIKNHYSTPNKYRLKPLEELESAYLVYENSDAIINDITIYHKFLTHEELKFSSQGRPLKGSLKTTKEICEITEFYPKELSKGEDFEYIKTELIINFIKSFTNIPYDNNISKYLKEIFYKYQVGQDFYTYSLLFHLKNLKREIDSSYGDYDSLNSTFNTYIFHLIQNLKVSKWYSFENIYNFSLYKDYNFNLIVPNDAKDMYFYIDGKYSSESEKINTDYLYKEAIIKPALKASFFLLSAFGLLDIAYSLPKNENVKSVKQEYLSAFDGLEYIKLTPLGAYIAGLTDTYEVKENIDSTKIILGENDLTISVHGNNKIKTMFIKTFANQFTENFYKVDYLSFLKDCENKKDIKDKISLFKKEITSKLPEIWNNFFAELLRKSTPLEKIEDIIIYKLINDPELVKLLLKDEILKNSIIKIENFQIGIERKNLSKVRKRLEQFGYIGSII